MLAAKAPTVDEYLPAMQSTQALACAAPVAVEYLPAAQSVQAVSLVDLYLPAGQSTHAVLAAGELEPAGQAVQAAEPFVFLNLPASHSAHGPPSAPVYPWKQIHAVLSVRAVSAWPELAAQVAHGAEPLLGLYAPAGQAAHGPPFGPVYPALHWQSAAASLPGGLALKAGHASHAWSPRPALKALAGHAAQAPE